VGGTVKAVCNLQIIHHSARVSHPLLDFTSVKMLINKALLSLLSFVIMCLSQHLIPLVESAHVFEVYRMFQYDKGPLHFGSQRTVINLFAATLSTLVKLDTLSQYVIILPLEHFNHSVLEQVRFYLFFSSLLIGHIDCFICFPFQLLCCTGIVFRFKPKELVLF
jgi:hypothetical protein